MTDVAARKRFRPTLWSSVAALTGIAILLVLGSWQVQRLYWKEALIQQLTERTTAPATSLPAEIVDAENVVYRRYLAEGTYRHRDELHLGSKTFKGAVGFRILTPFELTDGRLILVDRGWVPIDRRDPASRDEGQLAGTVTLEGLARRDGWTGSTWFRPDNKPGDNYWFWVDLADMARAIGAPDLMQQVYLQAVESDVPGGLPRGRPDGVTLSNNHLQYAITWYALAGTLLIIYVLFSLRVQAPPRDLPKA